MLSVPGLLTLCYVCAALTLRFIKTAAVPRHKMLRPPRDCKPHMHKVLRLPCEDDTVTLKGFQSIAPATQQANIIATHVRKRHKNMVFARKSHSSRSFSSHFARAAQRQGINAMPRTAVNGSGRRAAIAGKHSPTPRPPIINGNPSLRIREKECCASAQALQTFVYVVSYLWIVQRYKAVSIVCCAFIVMGIYTTLAS